MLALGCLARVALGAHWPSDVILTVGHLPGLDLGGRAPRLKARMKTAIRSAVVAALCLLVGREAFAHPAPFSYLDLHLDAGGVTGTLVVHDLDAAHDLEVASRRLAARSGRGRRLSRRAGRAADAAPRAGVRRPARHRDVGRARRRCPTARACAWRSRSAAAGRAASSMRAYMFPHDPIHQTFVNIYEDTALRHQAILDATRQTADYYSGTVQGRMSVVRTFVAVGHRAHPDRPRPHPVPGRPAAARRHRSSGWR